MTLETKIETIYNRVKEAAEAIKNSKTIESTETYMNIFMLEVEVEKMKKTFNTLKELVDSTEQTTNTLIPVEEVDNANIVETQRKQSKVVTPITIKGELAESIRVTKEITLDELDTLLSKINDFPTQKRKAEFIAPNGVVRMPFNYYYVNSKNKHITLAYEIDNNYLYDLQITEVKEIEVVFYSTPNWSTLNNNQLRDFYITIKSNSTTLKLHIECNTDYKPIEDPETVFNSFN